MGAGFQVRWNRPVRMLALVGLLICAAAPSLPAQTDEPSVRPYASMDRTKIGYRGAGREKSNDILNRDIRIGILLPISGVRAPEGKSLLQAAQAAIDEQNELKPLPDGKRFALAVADESGPWGQASSAMVLLILQDEAVALITSNNGSIAHQAEQIANKVGIAVLTLASDPTTTKINIPWIFRMAPSQTTGSGDCH